MTGTATEPETPTTAGAAQRAPLLRPADWIVLASLAGYTALALVFRATVEGWGALVAKNLLLAGAVVASAAAVRRIRAPVPRFLLRTATLTGCFGYLFEAVAPLQLVFHGRWFDDAVLAFEDRVFGVQPTLWLERWTVPWLTEWLMFSYLAYLPLYPAICAAVRVKRGEAALEECFVALAITHTVCNFGFLLFPVASPLWHMPDAYTVPLDGWVFTDLGEALRANLLYRGGSIPSPHAAAATTMLAMAWRHHRRTAWIAAPVVVSLWISTFYCRYHYVTDAVVGIAASLAVVGATPPLLRAWERRSGPSRVS